MRVSEKGSLLQLHLKELKKTGNSPSLKMNQEHPQESKLLKRMKSNIRNLSQNKPIQNQPIRKRSKLQIGMSMKNYYKNKMCSE